jgi:hypothetical protein
MKRTMDHARRRTTCVAVAALVLVVAATQLSWGASARADTPSTDPTTAPTDTTPPTTGADPGSTSTTADPGSTTTADPSTSSTLSGAVAPVPIPTLQTGSSAPTGPPLPDPSPQIRSLLGQIGVVDAQKTVTLAAQAQAGQQAALDQATAAQAAARAAVAAAQIQLRDARAQLSSVATLAFMGSSGGVLSSLMKAGPDAGIISRQLVKSTIQYHSTVVNHAEKALASTQSARGRADHQVADATTQLALARQAVDAATVVLTSARRDLAGGSRKAPWALSIEGDSAFTPAELSQWFTAQGHPSQATVPIDQLTGFYITEGQAEGVRGDMAFAQAMVETGSFSNPDTTSFNNYAGIGHCDSCASGFAFASAQLGVRGQIQLLKSYAEKTPTYVNPLVDPRLVGPAGCCQTWTQLTKTWASDPNYGPKILGVYLGMLQWLLKVRGAEPGPPPALMVSTSLVATSTTTSTTIKKG